MTDSLQNKLLYLMNFYQSLVKTHYSDYAAGIRCFACINKSIAGLRSKTMQRKCVVIDMCRHRNPFGETNITCS